MKRNTPKESKICATCGRRFFWRAKWRTNWPEVRYCSRACHGGPGTLGEKVAAKILAYGARIGPSATFCPSVITRDVFGEKSEWPKSAMEKVRQAARRLVAAGLLDILQANKIVDATAARGPIRLRVTSAGRAAARV